MPQRVPAQRLHARKALGERHEPKARRRTPALMQRRQAIFGSLWKHFGRGGETFDTIAEDQNKLVQAPRTDGRRYSSDPCRVDGV